jgi:hypothetical protein
MVDGDPHVSQEQAECLLSSQAIAEGLGQVALARNAKELLFGPGKEGYNLRQA